MAGSGSLWKAQSWRVLKSLENAAGTRDASGSFAVPASSRRTRALGSSVSRAANTQPAEPAPTTMKSKESLWRVGATLRGESVLTRLDAVNLPSALGSHERRAVGRDVVLVLRGD